jgi:hypothetical protein
MHESTRRRNRDPDAGDERSDAGERIARRDNGNGHSHEHNHRAPRRISGSAAVEYAKAHLMELTAQPCEAVSSLSRTRDGWRVALEVVELERIPRTTDILATYVVELDNEGDLMGYERVHRYYRNEVSSGES